VLANLGGWGREGKFSKALERPLGLPLPNGPLVVLCQLGPAVHFAALPPAQLRAVLSPDQRPHVCPGGVELVAAGSSRPEAVAYRVPAPVAHSPVKKEVIAGREDALVSPELVVDRIERLVGRFEAVYVNRPDSRPKSSLDTAIPLVVDRGSWPSRSVMRIVELNGLRRSRSCAYRTPRTAPCLRR
jgi:hypothetical protein